MPIRARNAIATIMLTNAFTTELLIPIRQIALSRVEACLGCKDNTIGRYCQACKPFYYRPSGKLLDDADVCQPCDCISPGVMKGVYECEGVS